MRWAARKALREEKIQKRTTNYIAPLTPHINQMDKVQNMINNLSELLPLLKKYSEEFPYSTYDAKCNIIIRDLIPIIELRLTETEENKLYTEKIKQLLISNGFKIARRGLVFYKNLNNIEFEEKILEEN